MFNSSLDLLLHTFPGPGCCVEDQDLTGEAPAIAILGLVKEQGLYKCQIHVYLGQIMYTLMQDNY